MPIKKKIKEIEQKEIGKRVWRSPLVGMLKKTKFLAETGLSNLKVELSFSMVEEYKVGDAGIEHITRGMVFWNKKPRKLFSILFIPGNGSYEAMVADLKKYAQCAFSLWCGAVINQRLAKEPRDDQGLFLEDTWNDQGIF